MEETLLVHKIPQGIAKGHCLAKDGSYCRAPDSKPQRVDEDRVKDCVRGNREKGKAHRKFGIAGRPHYGIEAEIKVRDGVPEGYYCHIVPCKGQGGVRCAEKPQDGIHPQERDQGEKKARDDVEGDDLIAYYVQHKKPNEKVVIVSGDRDLTQLIRDDVCQYIPSMKKFITPDNSVNELGMTHENVLVKKILCGDASDNIKGIKGMGEQTLLKLFPEMKNKKTSLEAVIARSKELLEERKANKKKPLKSLENVVNCVTDGVQGKDIYEINKKIIDLSEPLLTDEALEGLNEEMYAPMSSEGIFLL